MAKKKSYDEDFKKMIVELYENKKPVVEIKREYGIAEQCTDRRVIQQKPTTPWQPTLLLIKLQKTKGA